VGLSVISSAGQTQRQQHRGAKGCLLEPPTLGVVEVIHGCLGRAGSALTRQEEAEKSLGMSVQSAARGVHGIMAGATLALQTVQLRRRHGHVWGHLTDPGDSSATSFLEIADRRHEGDPCRYLVGDLGLHPHVDGRFLCNSGIRTNPAKMRETIGL